MATNFKANCNDIISVLNSLETKRNDIKSVRSVLSSLSVEDSSAIQIINNLDLFNEKLGNIIKNAKNFVSDLDNYENIKDNEDFTIKAVSQPTVSSNSNISKAQTTTQSMQSQTQTNNAKAIKIQSSGDTLWNLAIKNGYKGNQWQEIFRDANGNKITNEQASKLRIGDTIYLVGLNNVNSSPVTSQASNSNESTKQTHSSNNTFTDAASLKAYIGSSSILNSTRSCMIYARERANLYYKDNYNSSFSNSRGIAYAKDFDDVYQNISGYTVSNTPKVGSIVVFEANTNGAYSSGHTAFVESVSADGKSIVISETNWSGSGIQIRTINNVDTLNGISYVYKNV